MSASYHSPEDSMSRRHILGTGVAGLGWAALAHADPGQDAPIAAKDALKITKLETFLVKPRWLFLKVHTNAGIDGLGEPILEGRAKTCAEAVQEIAPLRLVWPQVWPRRWRC